MVAGRNKGGSTCSSSSTGQHSTAVYVSIVITIHCYPHLCLYPHSCPRPHLCLHTFMSSRPHPAPPHSLPVPLPSHPCTLSRAFAFALAFTPSIHSIAWWLMGLNSEFDEATSVVANITIDLTSVCLHLFSVLNSSHLPEPCIFLLNIIAEHPYLQDRCFGQKLCLARWNISTSPTLLVVRSTTLRCVTSAACR